MNKENCALKLVDEIILIILSRVSVLFSSLTSICRISLGDVKLLLYVPSVSVRMRLIFFCFVSWLTCTYLRLSSSVINHDDKRSKFSGAFAKLRKASLSFVMSVWPSAWNSAPTRRSFMKFGI